MANIKPIVGSSIINEIIKATDWMSYHLDYYEHPPKRE